MISPAVTPAITLAGQYVTNGRTLAQLVRPLASGAWLAENASSTGDHYLRVPSSEIDGEHWRIITSAQTPEPGRP